MASRTFEAGIGKFRVFAIPTGHGGWSMRVDDECGRLCSIVLDIEFATEYEVFHNAERIVSEIARRNGERRLRR